MKERNSREIIEFLRRVFNMSDDMIGKLAGCSSGTVTKIRLHDIPVSPGIQSKLLLAFKGKKEEVADM